MITEHSYYVLANDDHITSRVLDRIEMHFSEEKNQE